jgi:hypothetical protein
VSVETDPAAPGQSVLRTARAMAANDLLIVADYVGR